MENFRKWLWIAIIVILVIIFWLAYMYYFVECSSTPVSEMPWYCIYLLSNK